MSHEQLELDIPTEMPASFSAEYLTIAEAAKTVRCCERTIRRAIDCGELRAGRIRGANSTRGSFRIRPRDLDEWMFSYGA